MKLNRKKPFVIFGIQEIFRGASQVGCWWDRLPLGGQGDELLLLMTMILTTTMVTMLIDRHTLNFQNRQKFEQVVHDGEHQTSS